MLFTAQNSFELREFVTLSLTSYPLAGSVSYRRLLFILTAMYG